MPQAILLPLLLVMLYLVLFGPQRRAKRQRAATMAALGAGDEIVTIGGMHGRVAELGDSTVDVEVAEGVIVRYDRRAIATITRRHDAEDDDEVEDEDTDEGVDEESSTEPGESTT